MRFFQSSYQSLIINNVNLVTMNIQIRKQMMLANVYITLELIIALSIESMDKMRKNELATA
jgi:hypothetical protein